MDYTGLALFTDLDGTLFNRQRKVSPKNREALARFQAEGGLFGISTGRAPRNALDLLPKVPINTWSVVLNGAEAYNFSTGAVAFPHVLPRDGLTDFLGVVLERLPSVNVLLSTERRMRFLSRRDMADHDFLISHQPSSFVGLDQVRQEPWLKLLFCAPRPVLEVVEQAALDRGIFETVDRVYTSPTYLEFLPKGVHKGRCLRDLRGLDALRGRTVIAVGDYYNDLELLREADIAMAVDNALPEVKALADHILPDCDQDAIAYLIDEMIPKP